MFTVPRRHPLLVTMGIAAILTLSIIAWLSIDDESETFLYSPVTKTGSKAIKKVEMKLEGGAVVLSIILNSPLSCYEIYKQLGIEPLSINDRVYVPNCTIISPTFIQVHFKESTVI